MARSSTSVVRSASDAFPRTMRPAAGASMTGATTGADAERINSTVQTESGKCSTRIAHRSTIAALRAA